MKTRLKCVIVIAACISTAAHAQDRSNSRNYTPPPRVTYEPYVGRPGGTIYQNGSPEYRVEPRGSGYEIRQERNVFREGAEQMQRNHDRKNGR